MRACVYGQDPTYIRIGLMHDGILVATAAFIKIIARHSMTI